jgi:hypothetical protein
MRSKNGDTLIEESQRNYARDTPADRERIRLEGDAVYQDLADLVGSDPESPEVQSVMLRWHHHLRNFYEASPEVMKGLAHLYTDHPDFAALFQRMDPEMPGFMRQAVIIYADSIAKHSK